MRSIANFLVLPELRLILECCKEEASVEAAIRFLCRSGDELDIISSRISELNKDTF